MDELTADDLMIAVALLTRKLGGNVVFTTMDLMNAHDDVKRLTMYRIEPHGIQIKIEDPPVPGQLVETEEIQQ